LLSTVFACAIGVIVQSRLAIGGTLSLFASIGLIFAIFLTPATPANDTHRFLYLLGIGFFNGASIAPLVFSALAIDHWIVVSALVSTGLIFASLSASALISHRRSYFFLYGFLSSSLSVMLWLSLFNLFFIRSPFLFQVKLYFGLLMFCGYVLFDTQVIVERASRGDKDYIQHTLDLFVDLIAIFVRILIILTQKSEKKEKRSRNN